MSQARETVERLVRTAYTDDAPPMLTRLANFYLWVIDGHCKIRDVNAELVAMEFREAQYRVLAEMMEQAAAGEPVRIIIGKARKTGISTEIQCLFVFIGSMYELQRAVTLAHSHPAAKEIFDIARRAADEWKDRPPAGDVGGMRDIYWSDVDSVYVSGTAGGVAVGAGGTPSALHLSEVPKWERNKARTEYNATIAVPDVPDTIIAYESTFMGRDLFWKRFDDARRGKTGYRVVFIAWWHDPTLSSKPEPNFVRTKDERSIVKMGKLDGVDVTEEMLAWRRKQIAKIGEAVFRQEFPSTPEEAVQATEGLVLPTMRTALVKHLPFDPHQNFDRVGGIDFGYADPSCIWSGYRYDGRIWVDQVWWGVETLAGDQVHGLRDMTTYFCDPSALAWRKELQEAADRAGLRVKLLPAPRKKFPGEDCSLVEMRNLIQVIDSGKLMVIDDVADGLLEETDSLVWDERTGKPDMSVTDSGHHYDRVMALVYLVMGAFRPIARALAIPRRKQSDRNFRV